MSKEYELFLDDVRAPEEVRRYTGQPVYTLMDWVIVRNYDQFITCIEERGIPWTISFDHDLGFDEFLERDYEDYDPDNQKSGNDCAKWLLNYCLDHNLKPPQVVLIHSGNGEGSLDIKSQFDTFEKLYPSGIKIANYHISE